MARAASAFAISTKPKPRGLPVSRSVIRESFSTAPWGANNARTESSVAVNGRFPTYNLVTRELLKKRKGIRQEGPASWFENLTRVAVIGKETRWNSAVPRADKPKGHDPTLKSTANDFPTPV